MSTREALIVSPFHDPIMVVLEEFAGFPDWLEWNSQIENKFWQDLHKIMHRGRAPGRYRVYIQYCGPGYHYWNVWIQHEDQVYGPGPGMALVGFVQVKGEEPILPIDTKGLS